MVTMARARVLWTGGVPGGGISTFYVPSVSTDLSALKTFFTSLAPYLPAAVAIQIPNNVDLIDMASGHLVGNQPCAGSGSVAGSGDANYYAGVGARVVWQTGQVVNNRMLKGSTFLAPLSRGASSTDGTISDTVRTAIDGFALTLITADIVRVWHRPPVHTFSGGVWYPATSAQTNDRTTALRSRRY